ncbi:glycosyltransferase family 2 protein [Flavobacterium sp.]|uniref:glycosyltransferase family 2 protein n=1 Tax=Flavobacterium sp. TaxID=239 RepID=UPI003751DD56
MNIFSIITINYNDKFGLEKTIKSVVNQDYKDFEFIIIDGGSTDGSVSVIENYQSQIQYCISEKDSGVYNAMNKGIKVANGEFVLFMNSGDIFNNNNVLTQVIPHLNKDYDIYYGDNYKVKNEHKRKKTYPEKLSFSFFYSSSINHQSTFIRKKLFHKYFFYNEEYKIASDWEFFIYTICKMNVPYKYLGVTICDYDFTGISSSDKFRNLSKEEKATTIKKYFPLFEKDYESLPLLTSKRIQQVVHIQKFPMAWKVLKAFITVILIFISKLKR